MNETSSRVGEPNVVTTSPHALTEGGPAGCLQLAPQVGLLKLEGKPFSKLLGLCWSEHTFCGCSHASLKDVWNEIQNGQKDSFCQNDSF